MERIRQARIARGMSQRQLAQLVGVDPSYISLIERGQRTPSPQLLAAIAEALGLRPEELLRAELESQRWFHGRIEPMIEELERLAAQWHELLRRAQEILEKGAGDAE